MADLVETTVPDVFCSGIARVENAGGGCFRLVLFVDQQGPDGKPERAIVGKVIVPVEAIPDGTMLIMQALEQHAPTTRAVISKLLH
jgi:hypothetical protein